MPRFIVKLKEYYFEYSTIVDAPVTFGMQLEDFKDYIRLEYGASGLRDLPPRLERVEKHGTSIFQPTSAEDTLYLNCAGPNEDELTMDEIYQAYCLREPIRDGWIVP